jgi:hypothetical protein
LSKENELKEKTAIHLVLFSANFLAQFQKKRALRNSLLSNSPRAIPSFLKLLGCVKWLLKCHE